MSKRDGKGKPDGATNLAQAASMVLLAPSRLKFFRANGLLRLTVDGECSYLNVVVVCAMPLSAPDQCLCVRTEDGTEVGIIERLSELDVANRELVERDLKRRYVVPRILRVESVTERFGTVEWRVETDRGIREFTTQGLRDNVRRSGASRLILLDVDENRYDIPDLAALDSRSQQLISEQI